MRKIKRTEVQGVKQELIRRQEGLCPLCLKKLPSKLSDTALDHDHTTGEIRGVLHLGCNKAEGSMFNSIGRWGGMGKDYAVVLPYLKRLVSYLEQGGVGLIYHLHKTPEEIKEATRKRNNARARAKRAAEKEV